jgi:cysteinyl-tRNA synthetase
MTLTDVEDKALAQARKDKVSAEELTRRNEDVFFSDSEFLKIKVPDYTVRASTVVAQAVKLVKTLVKNGFAYWHTHDGERNAYFDPLKFAGFGKLAKLDMSKWPRKKRRFHKDTYPGTPWNRGDFILWHGCGGGEFCWDTAIGKGRPAWNVQDAAAVTEHLGFTIDIAAGGIDNLVRHHDYTLAVTESVSGKQFAKYWLHGAHLFVDGEKMSKSRGNVYYPEDLAAKGHSREQVRFFLIYGHYRKRLNFTFERLAGTSRKLDAFKGIVQDLRKAKSTRSSRRAKQLVASMVSGFEESMDDDLDVKTAFDRLFKTVSSLDNLNKSGRLSAEDANAALEGLRHVDRVLKVIF